jgi:hypothetical protein
MLFIEYLGSYRQTYSMRKGEMGKRHKISVQNPNGGHHLEHTGVNMRILKWVLIKQTQR